MQEIDAVITWVDGSDPVHTAKRTEYLGSPQKAEGFGPGKWNHSNELTYCLKSIGRFAPWVRRIWIVTDNQIPDLTAMGPALRDKIEIIDHKIIFKGHENRLPTFNSATIESALHLIPDLAECYLYFNDDFLLMSDCHPADFFTENGLVLRGIFVEAYSTTGIHTQHRLNAANMVGVEPGRLFRSSHVCHPMRKSLVEEFYAQHPGAFERNIRFRFRNRDQFLISTAVEHLAIAKGAANIRSDSDCRFITYQNCPAGATKVARRHVQRLFGWGVKLACINNFESLVETCPELLPLLEQRFAPNSKLPRRWGPHAVWTRVKRLIKWMIGRR